MAEHKIVVNTSGSAGSASGTGTTPTPVRGLIYAVKVDYNGSAPATTLVDLDETGGLGQKILDLAAGNTDKVLYPRTAENQNDGTALSHYTHYYVDGHYLTLSVANCNALTNAVIATVQVIE